MSVIAKTNAGGRIVPRMKSGEPAMPCEFREFIDFVQSESALGHLNDDEAETLLEFVAAVYVDTMASRRYRRSLRAFEKRLAGLAHRLRSAGYAT